MDKNQTQNANKNEEKNTVMHYHQYDPIGIIEHITTTTARIGGNVDMTLQDVKNSLGPEMKLHSAYPMHINFLAGMCGGGLNRTVLGLIDLPKTAMLPAPVQGASGLPAVVSNAARFSALNLRHFLPTLTRAAPTGGTITMTYNFGLENLVGEKPNRATDSVQGVMHDSARRMAAGGLAGMIAATVMLPANNAAAAAANPTAAPAVATATTGMGALVNTVKHSYRGWGGALMIAGPFVATQQTVNDITRAYAMEQLDMPLTLPLCVFASALSGFAAQVAAQPFEVLKKGQAMRLANIFPAGVGTTMIKSAIGVACIVTGRDLGRIAIMPVTD